jgi:hypothetical protein
MRGYCRDHARAIRSVPGDVGRVALLAAPAAKRRTNRVAQRHPAAPASGRTVHEKQRKHCQRGEDRGGDHEPDARVPPSHVAQNPPEVRFQKRKIMASTGQIEHLRDGIFSGAAGQD